MFSLFLADSIRPLSFVVSNLYRIPSAPCHLYPTKKAAQNFSDSLNK